ncbi:MAG: hypothetical protein NDJ90_07215 [Oligoflexia bacterium]|nr:hypothetical protein [Oligoflexia bacterium]
MCLTAVWSYPMLVLAYPELQVSQAVEIGSATAESHVDIERSGDTLLTVRAQLRFGNACLVPDVLFKEKRITRGLLQIWIRGVSDRSMLCPMIYSPVELNVLVDNEYWSNNEPLRIEVNGKEVEILPGKGEAT